MYSDVTARNDEYIITTDQSQFDIDRLYDFIGVQSYWAAGIPKDIFINSINNSLSFGLFHNDKQVGFARVITDYATFGYLADVFIDPPYRGRGLSKWLMEVIMTHPLITTLRKIMLTTRDAQSLYKKFGFTNPEFPDRVMEISRKEIYNNH